MRYNRSLRQFSSFGAMMALFCVLARPDIFAVAAEPDAMPIDQFAQWEEAIQEFEQQDAAHPPTAGGIVFVGSSSIRLWNLAKSFAGIDPLPVNRGFGGSQIADATHFVDRLVLKHRPRMIVFYAGDNDILAGKSPQEVAEDFNKFCKAVGSELPETNIVFIAIKPSPSRWQFAKAMQIANDLIRKHCEADRRHEFVDVWQDMIGPDGKPRGEQFLEDQLHLNDAGYEVWTKLLTPIVRE